MQINHLVGSIGRGGNFRNAERGGIRCQDRPGRGDLGNFPKRLFLQFHFLWNCFHHQVCILGRSFKLCKALDSSQNFLALMGALLVMTPLEAFQHPFRDRGLPI